MPGSSWASPSSPRATGARSSWRSSRAASTRSRPATLRRQIEAWNEVGGAMLFGRTPVDEVLAFLDEELAWARERGLRGGRGRRAARRPVPLRAPRPLRGGARPARALEGDLPRARHRVRARGGAHGGSRDGDARGGRRRRRAGATRRDRRRDGDGRVALRRALPHQARPRPRRAGPGRGRARRAGAGAGTSRGRPGVEDRPRARARAPRRDGGGRRARPRGGRLHGRHATTSPRTPRSSSTSPRCSARTATSPRPRPRSTRRSPSTRRRATSCPPSAAASCWPPPPASPQPGHTPLGRQNSPRARTFDPPGRMARAVVTMDEVRALARTLPRSSEAFVRGRVKFRIGRIVWLAFSRDGETMGFAFPKEWRDRARRVRPGEVLAAERVGHALPLGARPPRSASTPTRCASSSRTPGRSARRSAS